MWLSCAKDKLAVADTQTIPVHNTTHPALLPPAEREGELGVSFGLRLARLARVSCMLQAAISPLAQAAKARLSQGQAHPGALFTDLGIFVVLRKEPSAGKQLVPFSQNMSLSPSRRHQGTLP